MSPPSPDDHDESNVDSDVDHGESNPDTTEQNGDNESDAAEPDNESDDDPTGDEPPQGSAPAPASSDESGVSAAEDDPAMAESGSPTAEADPAAAEAGPATIGDDPTVVDSKWWYWVAAVPAYAAVGLLGGIVAFGLFIVSIGIDVAGGMGLATGTLVLVGTLVAVLYGLAGLVLFVMFPIGIYLDAQAIAEADVEWEPDPVLYGIVAVTTALFSALLVSLVVAIYYLYRRNQVLGTP